MVFSDLIGDTPLNFSTDEGVYLVKFTDHKYPVLRGVKNGLWHYIEPRTGRFMGIDYEITDPDYPDISWVLPISSVIGKQTS